jgi:hypothetical protein
MVANSDIVGIKIPLARNKGAFFFTGYRLSSYKKSYTLINYLKD